MRSACFNTFPDTWDTHCRLRRDGAHFARSQDGTVKTSKSKASKRGARATAVAPPFSPSLLVPSSCLLPPEALAPLVVGAAVNYAMSSVELYVSRTGPGDAGALLACGEPARAAMLWLPFLDNEAAKTSADHLFRVLFKGSCA